jgi:hypothetical protein
MTGGRPGRPMPGGLDGRGPVTEGVVGGATNPAGEGSNSDKPKDGSLTLSGQENTLLLNLDLTFRDQANYDKVLHGAEFFMVTLKAQAEMTHTHSRIHELARAMQAYYTAKGHFPRGTAPRAPTTEHPHEWAPEQRLSWMLEILPLLGDGEFRELPIDADKGWNEGANLGLAQIVVPQFMTPPKANAPVAYHIRYPSLFQPVAQTNFVGIAGVGLDAAEYPAKKPEVAKKLGIFGYDRMTTVEDIKDGPGNTILLIQAPTDHKSPWLAGGGSTVRGVSEDIDSVQPFVCTEYQGKKGTFAIMADYKVRFIPATIDPAHFRALCTVAGGEKLPNLESIAPEVPAEDIAPADAKKAELPK